MNAPPVIMWFRQDLRLTDNAALLAAIATGGPVVPVYVLDFDAPGSWAPGGASRWWLHHSLAALAKDLERLGSRLIFQRGPTRTKLAQLAEKVGAEAVYCTRAYQPWARALEEELQSFLKDDGRALKRYAGALLFEPEDLATNADEPFRVFTPFARKALSGAQLRAPRPAPANVPAPSRWPGGDKLGDLKLLPTKPDWAGGLRAAWTPGELGARKRIETFLSDALAGYRDHRDRPDLSGTSRLSPHLHHGEISPHACWHMAGAAAEAAGRLGAGLETFRKELLWREFSYHLLVHFPDLPTKPFRPEFAAFPWADDVYALAAWQRGKTGYPIVDAGMRELWATGWMHNRVRMIVASFLVKDLRIPWQSGARWFWDTLVDADLANNSASWQWVAGCGADAAPYFRIFNPVTQSQKFDPDGIYIRRWLPELRRLGTEHIHAPWMAPKQALEAAGVQLGHNYPGPIVDHAAARKEALAAFSSVKGGIVTRE
jgi:deoxyribodipyrimidine photo-lyase